MLSCVYVYQGSEVSIIVAVRQLERYPVDLYYLVDVSASMQENLDHVSAAVIVSLNNQVHTFSSSRLAACIVGEFSHLVFKLHALCAAVEDSRCGFVSSDD